MSTHTETSRELAARLRRGDHPLSNDDLRAAYGLSRVTAKARRAAERVAAAAPEPDVSQDSSTDLGGPSTVNWCGKRDGDGDGIYCEGE